MAASTSALTVVGGCVTSPPSLKATTPISTESGWRSTKARAAALAASIRVGSRSSARMLFDTSKARITVPSTWGSPTLDLRAGRRPRPAARGRRGTARTARGGRRLAAPCRRRGHEPLRGQRGRAAGPGAGPASTVGGDEQRRGQQSSRPAATGTTSALLPPAALDDAQERAHEVVLRSTRRGGRRPTGGRPPAPSAPAPWPRSWKRRRNSGSLRVDREQLAGLGVLHDDTPASGSSSSCGSTRRMATHLVALAEQRQRALPPRLADEVGHDDHDQRAAPDGARPARTRRSRSVLVPSADRGPQQVAGEAEHLAPAARGGTCARPCCRTGSRRPGCRRG